VIRESTSVTMQNKLDIKKLINDLLSSSVNGLSSMYDANNNLFCYRVKKTAHGLMKEGHSLRYTIISLLGLNRLQAHNGESPIDVQSVLHALIDKGHDIDTIGDIGLLLWLCALASPEWVERLYADLAIHSALSRFHDARNGKTTEIAWFLTGLTHVASLSTEKPKGLENLTRITYELLKENYGGKGIFRHQKKSSLSGMIRGRIGCFADQVYPIYALSKYAQAYNNKEALTIAKECGETICHLQGPLGQWWWHYDANMGSAIGRYPVYSVHQDGMAPMALFSLQDACGLDFSNAIKRGLLWITGNNELDFDLRDTSQNMIWRSFYQNKFEKYYERLSSLYSSNRTHSNSHDLMILFECRPYHLGWLLYAFADKDKAVTGK
jgi:hypothetical protein